MSDRVHEISDVEKGIYETKYKGVHLKLDPSIHQKAEEYASKTGRTIKSLCEYFLLRGLKEVAGYKEIDVI